MKRTRKILAAASVFLLVMLGTGGQTLKTRGATVTPELKAVYASPEYEGFYTAAETAYSEARPEQGFVPAAWDGRKALVWLMHSQRLILAYVHALEALKQQLDLSVEDPRVRSDAEKVAQISEIEDRLTRENLETVNVLIRGVDLGSLFTGNHKPGMAKVWSPRRVPESLHMLDENKMNEVVAALEDVNTCLSRSSELQVQYARTASFSANVPMDENDKPLTRQQAQIFWQAYTHPPLDKAIAGLYGSLSRAQAVAKAEGLTP